MPNVACIPYGEIRLLLGTLHETSATIIAMAKQSLLFFSTLVLSAYARSPVLPLTDQPLIGRVYLPPANGSFSAFDDARTRAKAWIDQALATGDSEYGAIDTQETSFSISVFSTDSNETLFTYHYEAPLLNGSLTRGKLTDDTIYRTGSLGKLLSVYQFLVDVGDNVFLDPITKYIVSSPMPLDLSA